MYNDESTDLTIHATPNLSTPEDLVGMISETLHAFGLIGDDE